MKLPDFLKARLNRRKTRTPALADPFAGFTPRDWADLPPYHPAADAEDSRLRR